MLLLFNILLLACLELLHAQRSCPMHQLRELDYNCVLHINDIITRMYCGSTKKAYPMWMNTRAPLSMQFNIIADTHEIVNLTDVLDFRGLFDALLRSKYKGDSNFYTCFIDTTSVIISRSRDKCLSNHDCLDYVHQLVKKSYVKRIFSSQLYNTDLDFESLSEFTNLSDININDAKSAIFNSSSFRNFILLKSLSLRNASIRDLPEKVFIMFVSLQYLDLSYNKITQITQEPFGLHDELKKLYLQNNLIHNVTSNSFTGMRRLTDLDLSSNRLTFIHENVFQKNEFLENINLSNNPIESISETLLENLKHLKNITLFSCKIKELGNDVFKHSYELRYVDLSKNEIRVIPNDLFKDNPNIISIDLSYNKIFWLHKDTLKNKQKLHILKMRRNYIVSLDESTFFEAPNLQLLDISQNKLSLFYDTYLEKFIDLKELNLTDNTIKYVQFGLTSDVKVRRFILAKNQISKFIVEWHRLISLEELALDYNNITELVLPQCNPNIRQATRFSFRYNKISHINVTSLNENEEKAKMNQTFIKSCILNNMPKNTVSMSHNPFHCDCNLYSFYKYMKQDHNILVRFRDNEECKCENPLILQNETIINLHEDIFSCPIEENCPIPCTCGIRGKDNQIMVNCSSKGLDTIPSIAPKDTTVLYFQNNKLRSANSLNNIVWTNLKEVYLDNNGLKSISVWKKPRTLRILSLRSNELAPLPPFSSNISNFQLFIGQNSRNCDCESVKLKKWIENNAASVKDKYDILCDLNDNGTVLPLVNIFDSVLCNVKQTSPSPTLRNSIISISIVLALLLSITLFYYKHRQLVLSFAYVHCNWAFFSCFKERNMDKDKIFDAFIAYSSLDREIVMALMEELENKEPYFKLCIHERNWIPGQFISQNIVNSVQESRRTILLLSQNFMSSVWFAIELRATFFQMMKDKRDRLVVIVVGQVPSVKDIDDDLKQVLSRKTYLEWGEQWFWEKLRYAMPHKSKVNASGMGSQRRRLSSEMVDMVEHQISSALGQNVPT